MMKSEDLAIEYSDRNVTAWGGMKLMKDLVDRCRIKDLLRTCDLPQPQSNRGYDPIDIVESFWTSIWIGASRFTHCSWLRFDATLKEIFNWKEVPSQSTYSRFFSKFSLKRNTEVFPKIQRWFFEQLRFDNMTIDLDSSVMTRYGEQEGAKVGYNPQKRGRASHHPLIAFMAEMRMVVNAYMRSGNTSSLSNVRGFLDETFGILQNKKVGLVRADSGFFSEDFMRYFEDRATHYVVAAKFYAPIKSELRNGKTWIRIADGIDITEWDYKLPGWSKTRRMVAVRKNVERRPKASGRLLLFDVAEERYRYSTFVTDLDLPMQQIWNMYRDRGDAENRIKELKYDFGADSFCLKKFFATEASFRFIMIAYNLISLFRQIVLKEKNQATLSSIRFKCFALGSWISRHANQRILKIALAREKRAWLDGLFDTAKAIHPPFQFSNA
jgi:hypothetical protein